MGREVPVYGMSRTLLWGERCLSLGGHSSLGASLWGLRCPSVGAKVPAYGVEGTCLWGLRCLLMGLANRIQAPKGAYLWGRYLRSSHSLT